MRLTALMTGVIIVPCLSISLALADTPDRRWYFGGGVSYLSSTDFIRNNAAIINTEQFGDDGVPFTGDPGELTACSPNPGMFFPEQDPFCDPRPDDLLAREASIEEAYKFDLTVGLQLTRSFGLHLDAGYFEGEVGPIDVYHAETIPVFNAGLPIGLTDRRASTPIAAGDLTEIPISLTAVLRFRNRKPLRPYLALGGGMILTDLEVNDSEIEDLRARVDAMRVIGFGNEWGNELTDPMFINTIDQEDGKVPFRLPLNVEVEDSLSWHIGAGAEYFFNERFSVVVDARYVFADQEVVIDLGGEDQIDIVYWPSEMFHPDGSQRIFFNQPIAPNPPCIIDPFMFGCFEWEKGDRMNPEGLRVNPKNPDEPLSGVTCPAVDDFDRNRQEDVCYKIGAMSPSGHVLPTGMTVIQGGSIDLTAFSIGVSFRFHL